MSDIMWMDGTAATGWVGFNEWADRNPLRWSSPQTFQSAGTAITEKKDKGELTAVWIKVPAKLASKTLKYASVAEALSAIHEMDPAFATSKKAWEQAVVQLQHLEEKQAGMKDELAQAADNVKSAETKLEVARSALGRAKAAEEEAWKAVTEAQTDKDSIQSDLQAAQAHASKTPSGEALSLPAASDVMWMDGTAATGLVGFNEWADNNPLRWKGPKSFQDAVKTITEKGDKGELTAVWIKVPAKMSSKTLKYSSVKEAVAAICSMDPATMALLEKRAKSMEARCEEARAAVDEAKAAVEQAREAVNEAEQIKEEASQQQKGVQKQAETIQSGLKEARERASKLCREKRKAEHDNVA